MSYFESDIEDAYQRALDALGDTPEEVEGHCLTTKDVLFAHFSIINHFYLDEDDTRGIGGIGPRDIGLLQSAVFRQHASFGGNRKWAGCFEICATLFFGLIKNHPFHDANKRTAFLSALYYLYREGWCPSVPERQFEDLTVQVAENMLGKYARYQSLLETDPDPEVRFLSWYMRKNTRKIDKKDYTITYKQLDHILRRYGYYLANPHGNFIDVARRSKVRPFLGIFGREREEETRIGQLGFPRWSSQVSKDAIKKVRQMTGLTAERGIDSAAFFKGVDPMQNLIASYHEPLMRLAYR